MEDKQLHEKKVENFINGVFACQTLIKHQYVCDTQ